MFDEQRSTTTVFFLLLLCNRALFWSIFQGPDFPWDFNNEINSNDFLFKRIIIPLCFLIFSYCEGEDSKNSCCEHLLFKITMLDFFCFVHQYKDHT